MKKKLQEPQKTVKPLKLNKETLSQLASSELRHAAGGTDSRMSRCFNTAGCCLLN